MSRKKLGVLLYGPPAAGKDTVTRALAKLESRYGQFARLKAGSGKSGGYRMGTTAQLRELEAAGDVIYANSRYGNTYVIDRQGLDAAFAAGVPVVHLGQIDGIRALVEGFPADWVRVLLWCSQEETAQRSIARGDSDTTARLAAWEATREDMDTHPDLVWDLRVDTTATPPEEAAGLIDRLVAGRSGALPAPGDQRGHA
ncbi:AAA family ATPase [Streptomyces sp. NPDC006872]|uniref:phosphotransferase-like protein n=1 Tax=Streptomyces sp. NPDC006872 TaxID=3155720 RepID=UPI0033C611B2